MNARKPNYLGSALLAATTLVVAACSGGGGGGPSGPGPTPTPQNTAPAIAAITDRSADQDTVITLDVAVSDSETSDASLLAVTAKADGNGVFPADDGVVLSGSGATRTLTLTPLEKRTGATMITVTAADPQGLSTTRTFAVNVNAKLASGWGTMEATLRKGRNDEPTQLNGLTFQADATETEVARYLPAPEPIAGIESIE